MIKQIRAKYLAYILILIALATAGAGFIVLRSAKSDVLTVAFLNIGQGDAIYIEAPNGRQVVVDGGPDGTLMQELGKVMPFYDRSIDMIVVTNPDRDHYAGFIDALSRYRIGSVLLPGTHSNTETYATFERAIKEHAVPATTARQGERFVLDTSQHVYLDILFPDRDVSKWKSNDGSVVARLVYGDTSVMLMGDATTNTESIVLKDYEKTALHSTILKVGHHGSKTSSSEAFLEAVAPEEAVISAGYHNSYGLPKKEILDRLSVLHIPTLVTYKEGTIVFQSDGKTFWRK